MNIYWFALALAIILTLLYLAINEIFGYPSLLGECRHYQAFDEDGVMYGEWYLKGMYNVEYCDPAT